MSTQVWLDGAPDDFTITGRVNPGNEEPFAVVEVTPSVSVVLRRVGLDKLMNVLVGLQAQMEASGRPCPECEGTGTYHVHRCLGGAHIECDDTDVPCCACDGSGRLKDDQGTCLDRGVDDEEMCPRCFDIDTDRKVAARYSTREQVTAPVTPETDPWSIR